MITKYLLTYFAMLATFLGLDLVWLGWIAKRTYQNQLGHVMRENIQWTTAIAFYMLFVMGIFIFAVLPAYEKDTLWNGLELGALFGFFTYMTFELTAFSTLKNWPLPIVFLDIFWGIVLSSLVSIVGLWIFKSFH